MGENTVAVYDLEVEDAHEFFANGILVHNSEQKDGNDPDYTVGVLMGIDESNRVWVLDVRRGRWSPAKVKQQVRTTADDDGKDVEVLIEQEGGASGKMVGFDFKQLLSDRNVRSVKPDGDKVTRAFKFSAAVEKGQVWLAAGAWNKAYIGELVQFPAKGVHDDQVDGSSAGYNQLSRGKVIFI